MDLKEIKQTELWELYEKSRNYCRLHDMFWETDRNYRFYNGDQWDGVKLKGIEPVQLNFIKPIVRYKNGVIHSNLYAIHYSSENIEDKKFKKTSEETCELLNKKASVVWEKDNMDLMTRTATRDASINGEGLIYANWNIGNKEIVNEVIKKNDIFYGNENDSDIQRQPYIIIKQRLSVSEVIETYKPSDTSLIVGDKDTFENSGEASKIEKDDLVTVLTKMYKENGQVHYKVATRYCELKKDTNSGLSLYPVAHFLWEDMEGSARGQGEVKPLIPNQMEVNKTIMRRLLVAKNTAYPQKIVNVDKIINPSALDSVGGIIKVSGTSVDDVQKVFANINPAQMSNDVELLQQELISITRELAGAGDIANGDVDPSKASGKAILAVQQASQQPLTEQLIGFKKFIEDLARIWVDLIVTYNKKDGLNFEREKTDETGSKKTDIVKVHGETLEKLRTSVKVDITPKSSYDKFAQEQSIENLLQQGFFNIERIGELKAYANSLDDDANMPKQKLLEIIEYMETEQRKIAEMNAQAQLMQQRASQFLNSDLEGQGQAMAQAREQMEQEATE